MITDAPVDAARAAALEHMHRVQPAMVQSREQIDFLRRFADDVGVSGGP